MHVYKFSNDVTGGFTQKSKFLANYISLWPLMVIIAKALVKLTYIHVAFPCIVTVCDKYTALYSWISNLINYSKQTLTSLVIKHTYTSIVFFVYFLIFLKLTFTLPIESLTALRV